MQPGMPQGFGTVGPDDTPIFTLPGNPVSSYVSFELFVRPVIRSMLGIEPIHRPTIMARCTKSFDSPEGRRQYARAWLEEANGSGRPSVPPVGGAGSHLMGDLAQANALIVVPEDVKSVAKGDRVEVMSLATPHL